MAGLPCDDSDLSLPPFQERDAQPRRSALGTHRLNGLRDGHSAFHLCPGAQGSQGVGVHTTSDLYQILFLHTVPRVHDEVSPGAVVGQEEESRAVHVEAAHRIDALGNRNQVKNRLFAA
jgi:hypothetical protein